jgi:PAS domain S-box-containing protein
VTTGANASRRFLDGGGESGALIRAVDWSRTPIGPIERWPASLKTAVRILLDCKMPMYLAWGREFTQLYNDAYRPILGNKHPAMGMTASQTWPEIWPTIGPMWEQVWHGEAIGFDDFVLTIDRYGYAEDCYFDFSYSAVPDDDGNVAGILVTFAETTAKVTAQKNLSASEQRYRTLADSLPQLMWGADRDGGVTYVNEQCLRYTGLASAAEFAARWTTLIHEDDASHALAAWSESMRTGAMVENEHRIRGADGGYRCFLVRAVPTAGTAGSVEAWIATATDIEDHRRTIRMLEDERSLREQFVATLTHDLRNPLTAARLSADRLRQGVAAEKVTQLAKRIGDSLTRANRLIENLLDASRIKAGEMLHLQLRPTDLVTVATETLEDLTAVHGDRFVLESMEQTLEGVWCAISIRRMLENLCANAVKYGDAQSVVTVRLARAAGDDGLVSMSVRNFGNPISEEHLKMLFSPFKRTPNATNQSGWGLGLTLVKGLAEAHHGSVQVESSTERGTLFTVLLPLEVLRQSEDAVSAQ